MKKLILFLCLGIVGCDSHREAQNKLIKKYPDAEIFNAEKYVYFIRQKDGTIISSNYSSFTEKFDEIIIFKPKQ